MARSWEFFTIAEAWGFEPRIGQHHHVRVVRVSDRLTLIVDGHKIVSARIPDLDAPVLQLMSWGIADATVGFDNLEIRARGRRWTSRPHRRASSHSSARSACGRRSSHG